MNCMIKKLTRTVYSATKGKGVTQVKKDKRAEIINDTKRASEADKERKEG